MAQRKTLITLEVVTDCDTGTYRVGELDFGLHGELIEYIKRYGYEGKREVLATLGHLAYHVERYFQDAQKDMNGPVQAGQ
jgi:hypothetical protein